MIRTEFITELFNEIVIRDFYNLRHLPKDEFDTIIDLGGNIGMFSQYAKTLFPHAEVLVVEANEALEGDILDRLDGYPDIQVLMEPVGTGKEVSAHFRKELNDGATIYGAPVEGNDCIKSQTLDEMLQGFDLENALIKIDIEGSEQTILEHPGTVDVLRSCKRVVAETHWGPAFVAAGCGWVSASACEAQIRELFSETHDIQCINRHLKKDPRKEDGSGVVIMSRKGGVHGTGTWVSGCARCGQNHFVNFQPFTRPNPNYSAWGLCPITGEPVLQKEMPLPSK